MLKEYRASWLLTTFVCRLAYFFCWVEPNFKQQWLYFQFCGNLVDGNTMYEQLQKICRQKVCCINVFRTNFGLLHWCFSDKRKFAKISFAPPKIAYQNTCDSTQINFTNLRRVFAGSANDQYLSINLKKMILQSRPV